ncbi:GntR family transcriptional regulator [Streptomyces sp. GESEQ-35]|uniref:GntR family transcriptional regulator n=1 Tax=Streptomyces sp. GESEQ-35 TaxID=2812657 RepID=UPI0027E25CAF|nr:GntR family transcriptional regulator [Streptomyces sp. GESEQ-35]
MPQASPRGTHLQVSEALSQKIKKGEITEALPSQATLMSTYGVSRSTIERALSALKADGVIESVQGAGWFVAGTGDRRPLVERVTDLLRADGVKVGDRFPTEKELCDLFGASRTAVRSAIAQQRASCGGPARLPRWTQTESSFCALGTTQCSASTEAGSSHAWAVVPTGCRPSVGRCPWRDGSPLRDTRRPGSSRERNSPSSSTATL